MTEVATEEAGLEALPAAVARRGAADPAVAPRARTAASPIAVVDQNTGFDPTSGADTSDGVHANASGAMKVAARWFATLAPSIP